MHDAWHPRRLDAPLEREGAHDDRHARQGHRERRPDGCELGAAGGHENASCEREADEVEDKRPAEVELGPVEDTLADVEQLEERVERRVKQDEVGRDDRNLRARAHGDAARTKVVEHVSDALSSVEQIGQCDEPYIGSGECNSVIQAVARHHDTATVRRAFPNGGQTLELIDVVSFALGQDTSDDAVIGDADCCSRAARSQSVAVLSD
jgi:hypothetical protein